MNRKRSKKGIAKSLPAGILIGLSVSLLVTLCISGLTAYLVIAEKIQTDSIGYASIGILILSSATGTLTAAKAVKTKRFMTCGCMAGAYFLSLLAINALFFGGQYDAVAATAISVLIGGFLGFFMTSSQNLRRKHKGKIGAYR